jgi:hypothetical protein
MPTIHPGVTKLKYSIALSVRKGSSNVQANKNKESALLDRVAWFKNAAAMQPIGCFRSGRDDW